MENEQFTIEDIEAYCLGEMETGQKQAFETLMQQEIGFKNKVQAYQAIFDGFISIKSESFSAQINSWASEWQETDEIELIEWYLKGELGEKAEQAVQEKINTEPAFARAVKAQKELLLSFEAARNADFAKQLQRWDVQEEKSVKIRSLSPWVKRLAMAASFLLVITVGIGWYINSQFSNQALFAAYYQSPNIGGTLGGQSIGEFQEQFSSAHRALQAEDFAQASKLFKQLQSRLPDLDLDPLALKYYMDNIAWSIVLADLGSGNTGAGFQSRLEAIANNPDQEYQQQAAALLAKTKSIFY